MDTWHKILNAVIVDTVRCEKPPKDIATGEDGNPVWRIEVRDPDPDYDPVTQTLSDPVETIKATEVNYARQVAEKPVDEARAAACEDVNRQRELWEQSGFVHDGNLYQSDYLSTQRIQMAIENAHITEANTPGSFTVNWRTADNRPITHDYQSFGSMHSAMAAYFDDSFNQAVDAKQQIDVSDNEQIRGILSGLSAPDKGLPETRER